MSDFSGWDAIASSTRLSERSEDFDALNAIDGKISLTITETFQSREDDTMPWLQVVRC